MSNKRQVIDLTDFTCGIYTGAGLTLLSRSDALEGGGYIPPSEIYIPSSALVVLRDFLISAKLADDVEF